jgi:hypothetical protein
MFRRIGLMAGAATLVAGCADLGRVTSLAPQQVDPNSAVAEQVRAASRAKVAFPRFRDVPPLPADVRPASAFKTAVASSNAAGADLLAYAAANPPSVAQDPAQTEAFAAAQRARIPADQRAAPTTAGTEEFAARLREQAAPPPPPK